MQNHLNLLYREEEREMLPLCADQGVGVIPWSPLARGRLTRPLDVVTDRTDKDLYAKTLYHTADHDIIDTVQAIAADRGLSMAQVALAWVAGHATVTAPIVGVTKLEQLEDALVGVDIELSADERTRLETPYTPQPIYGIS